MGFADSHCHIDLPDFDADRDKVLEAALALSVNKILVPGLSLSRMDKLLSLKRRYEMLDICAGFHPYFLHEIKPSVWPQYLDKMTAFIAQHRQHISAIGECGLDGSIDIPMAFQIEVLHAQFELARRFLLPIVLHHRQSHNELIRVIKQAKHQHRGIIHAFSGSQQIAQTYIDLGFYLGIGGTITYPRGKKTRDAIVDIDLKHLLLETDAPDMPLCGFQGQRNSPTQLPKVASALAELKGISCDEVGQVTSNNYKSLLSSGSIS
jgi:TatD DNase family protein